MWGRPKPAPQPTSGPFKASRYTVDFIHQSHTLALSCIHTATHRGQLSTPGKHGVFNNDGTLVAWVTVS